MANGQIEPVSDEQSQLQLTGEIVNHGVSWILPGFERQVRCAFPCLHTGDLAGQ
jgi:hypothetical protein